MPMLPEHTKQEAPNHTASLAQTAQAARHARRAAVHRREQR